ncbi:MAG: hypothetical protein QF357_00275 [Dehalococcoidia bacterium]|jgi:hypothetical protein|nr:hypothetical protein [Dehalococcoidia bacterium]
MFQFIGRRRPAVAGLIIGGAVGLIAALGYGLTGAWLCTGIRACPASWQPFALVSSIIFAVVTVIGVFVAIVGARLYRIFDTALGTENAVTTIIPASRAEAAITPADQHEADS